MKKMSHCIPPSEFLTSLPTLKIHLNSVGNQLMRSHRLECSFSSPPEMTLCTPVVLQGAQGSHSFDNTGFKIQNCGIAQEDFQKNSVTWWSLCFTQQRGSTMKHLVKSSFEFLSFPFFCIFALLKSMQWLLGRTWNEGPCITSISHLYACFNTVTPQGQYER